MASNLDDDSTPTNARVWDFAMPPKSCWTLPLSSENPAVAERLSIAVMALCDARFGVVAAVSAAESQPRDSISSAIIAADTLFETCFYLAIAS